MNFGIFFDGEKEGVDFLINTIDGKIIPIEVGIGKKKDKFQNQLKDTIQVRV